MVHIEYYYMHTIRIDQTCHPVVGTGIAGGVLQTVLQGEGGGISEIRKRGVGDFIFGKLTVIFKIFKTFVHLSKPPRIGPTEGVHRLTIT